MFARRVSVVAAWSGVLAVTVALNAIAAENTGLTPPKAPLGLPPIFWPDDNPYTPEKAARLCLAFLAGLRPTGLHHRPRRPGYRHLRADGVVGKRSLRPPPRRRHQGDDPGASTWHGRLFPTICLRCLPHRLQLHGR